MLVLSRKTSQDILMPGHEIIIRVLEIRGQKVKLGIEAPGSVRIWRVEVPIDSSTACGPCCDAGAENLVSASSVAICQDEHIPAK